MKAVLASQNAHKLKEIQAILSGLGVEVVPESALGLDIDVDENGATFEENSRLKAEAVMRAAGMPAIADDSGLMVDALDGAPGVHSARYGPKGHAGTDDERTAYLLENMKAVPDEARTAKFVCVITCLWPDGREIVARGECCGRHGRLRLRSGVLPAGVRHDVCRASGRKEERHFAQRMRAA